MLSKNKVGVLLPQSNAYPSMGKSFLNGMHLALKEIKYNLIIESIGSGSDPKQLINSFQKLCFQENVILTTGILGHYGFKELTDFAGNNQETLIAANFGSKHPLELPDGVFQNSLGLYDSLQLLAEYLLQNNKTKMATSTCYYEAGYGFIEALDSIISQENISFSGHYITPLHPRKNESELMHRFFSEIKPDAIIAFHNNIFAREHAFYLEQNQLHLKHPMYMLPFSAEEALLKEYPEVFNTTKTISSWYPELNTESNKLFTQEYWQEFNKSPDFFALLGYENGLVIRSTFNKSKQEFSTIIKHLKLEGPRGVIDFNNSYNRTSYDHYIWNNESTNQQHPQRSIYAKLNKKTFTGSSKKNNTGWFNTYLCH